MKCGLSWNKQVADEQTQPFQPLAVVPSPLVYSVDRPYFLTCFFFKKMFPKFLVDHSAKAYKIHTML